MSSASTSSASASASASTITTAAPRKHRKLNRSNNQLRRNAACLPCRRRRIKCDAAKPHCASCVRSFQFLQRTNPDQERDERGVVCWYEDEEGGGEALAEPEVGKFGQEVGGDRRYSGVEVEGRRYSVDRGGDGRDYPSWRNRGSGYVHDHEQAQVRLGVDHLERALASDSEAGPSTLPNTTEAYYNPQSHQPPPLPVPMTIPQGPGGTSWMNAPLPPPTTTSSYPNFPQGEGHDPNAFIPENQDQVSIIPRSIGMNDFYPSSAPAPAPLPDLNNVSIDTEVEGERLDGEAGKVGGAFMELIWPGWPYRLPTPAMLDHLVQVFFTMVPSISRLLHRQTFLSRLRLSPTHPNFPHVALLHAICAVSARYSAAVKTLSVEDWIKKVDGQLGPKPPVWSGVVGVEEGIAMEVCFGERNAKYAQLEARLESAQGRKLVDVVQAMALLCYYNQQHADWINGWMGIAQAVRASIPLGLMRNEHSDGPTLGKIMKPGHSLLPPPTEDWDREERRVLMFTVLMFDINASSSSGWPNMMMTDELYTKLPCSRTDFESMGDMTPNPQTARSPDLYTNHPVEDSYVLLLKGGILSNRVNKFVRFVKASEPNERGAMKQSMEFQQLDEDIKSFIRHFPASLRNPLKHLTGMHKGIDADLISAHLLPHVAAIFLHEPFADLTDPNCTSAIRLSTESRACLGIIHLVTSTSLDLSYTLVPITSCDYCFTAARTLLLFYQRALELSDLASAKVLLSEIEILRLAFKALSNRFAMGARHGGMLKAMMNRITVEFGGKVPVQKEDQDVAPEPNMPAGAYPTSHPDLVFSSRLRDTPIEPLRESLDYRRGFVAKSASIHSLSPSNPSPPSASSHSVGLTTGLDQMMNPPYTSSPLQHHIPNPNAIPNAEANYINPSIQGMAQAAEMSEKAYDPNTFRANNFGFTNGQNGWNGLGNVNPMSSVDKIPNPLVDMGPGGIAVPDPVLEFGPDPIPTPGPGPGPGDMGFDWLNWMSTANIAMGPVDEQYGIH